MNTPSRDDAMSPAGEGSAWDRGEDRGDEGEGLLQANSYKLVAASGYEQTAR